MGQITQNFVDLAMATCKEGRHPSLTVWEAQQLLHAWIERDEANRVCEQWRQWTVATRAENETLRARVAEQTKLLALMWDRYIDGTEAHEWPAHAHHEAGPYIGIVVKLTDEEEARIIAALPLKVTEPEK